MNIQIYSYWGNGMNANTNDIQEPFYLNIQIFQYFCSSHPYQRVTQMWCWSEAKHCSDAIPYSMVNILPPHEFHLCQVSQTWQSTHGGAGLMHTLKRGQEGAQISRLGYIDQVIIIVYNRQLLPNMKSWFNFQILLSIDNFSWGGGDGRGGNFNY